MTLTMTKYHENLLRDSPLSLLSIVFFYSFLATKMMLKIQNETFKRITHCDEAKEQKKTVDDNYLIESFDY